jgi:hypothetical protein
MAHSEELHNGVNHRLIANDDGSLYLYGKNERGQPSGAMRLMPSDWFGIAVAILHAHWKRAIWIEEQALLCSQTSTADIDRQDQSLHAQMHRCLTRALREGWPLDRNGP